MNEKERVVLTDLAIGISMLLLQRRSFEALNERPDSRSTVIGAVEAFCYQYVVEHDPVASMLDSYPDRVAFGFGRYLFNRSLPRLGVSSVSMDFGGGAGFVCYCLVFGAILDVPESRFERPSLFDRWRRSENDPST